jgi:hypothetical protein
MNKGFISMVNDSEITDLSAVYSEMDTEGKKKMVWMAKQLLNVQLTGKGQNKENEEKKCENGN